MVQFHYEKSKRTKTSLCAALVQKPKLQTCKDHVTDFDQSRGRIIYSKVQVHWFAHLQCRFLFFKYIKTYKIKKRRFD